MRIGVAVVVLPLLALVAAGCAAGRRDARAPAPDAGGDHPYNAMERPTDSIARGGRVGLAAFALAGRVTWEATRTLGRAARGLVEDGKTGAQRGFTAGSTWTKTVARQEAGKLREASRPVATAE